MKQNTIVAALIAAVVAGGLGFVGGMQYQKTQTPARVAGQFPGGQNGQPRNFQGGNGGTGNGAARTGGGNFGQPVSGEITSVDGQTITVKAQDGGSKIVVLSESTTINKTSEGSSADLADGTQVMVIGTENSDGSVTAQNISIGGGMNRMMIGEPSPNP